MKKYCNGSSIVEMAYVMPVILFMWACIIFALFYYHDKSILEGAAYETVVVGSELWVAATEEKEQRCCAYMQERVNGKLLFFEYFDVMVEASEEKLVIEAYASKYGMSLRVKEQAVITNPEAKVRELHVLKKEIEENVE